MGYSSVQFIKINEFMYDLDRIKNLRTLAPTIALDPNVPVKLIDSDSDVVSMYNATTDYPFVFAVMNKSSYYIVLGCDTYTQNPQAPVYFLSRPLLKKCRVE